MTDYIFPAKDKLAIISRAHIEKGNDDFITKLNSIAGPTFLNVNDLVDTSQFEGRITHVRLSLSGSLISTPPAERLDFDVVAAHPGIVLNAPSLHLINPENDQLRKSFHNDMGEFRAAHGKVSFFPQDASVRTQQVIKYSVKDVNEVEIVSTATLQPATDSEKDQIRVEPYGWFPDFVFNNIKGYWLFDRSEVAMAKTNWPYDIDQQHVSRYMDCEVFYSDPEDPNPNPRNPEDGTLLFLVRVPNNIRNKPGLRIDMFLAIKGFVVEGLVPKEAIIQTPYKTSGERWQEDFNI